MNSIPKPVRCDSYHRAACSASSAARGWMCTRFKNHGAWSGVPLVPRSTDGQFADWLDTHPTAHPGSACDYPGQARVPDLERFGPTTPARRRCAGLRMRRQTRGELELSQCSYRKIIDPSLVEGYRSFRPPAGAFFHRRFVVLRAINPPYPPPFLLRHRQGPLDARTFKALSGQLARPVTALFNWRVHARASGSCILTVRASTTPMRSAAKHHIYATWQHLVTSGW